MRFRKDPRRRLAAIAAERRRLHDRAAVLDEQLAYQRQLAADARTDELVADTPLASRESRAAHEDARRTQRERDEITERLAELQVEQDRLLERLAQSAAPERGAEA